MLTPLTPTATVVEHTLLTQGFRGVSKAPFPRLFRPQNRDSTWAKIWPTHQSDVVGLRPPTPVVERGAYVAFRRYRCRPAYGHHPAPPGGETIAERVTIGTSVLDVRLLDATPAAAAWYGVNDPAVLRGCWQSQLSHPEDAWLATVFMEAHRRGLPAPTRYVCRVRQVPLPDRYVPVTTETLHLTLGTEVYCLTILSEPTELPLGLQPDIWGRFPMPPESSRR